MPKHFGKKFNDRKKGKENKEKKTKLYTTTTGAYVIRRLSSKN